jgi:hypothetical protein
MGQFQVGNRVAIEAYQWRKAVDIAANTKSRVTKLKAIQEAANKLLELAIAGDMSALKELGNRLDGMAHQSVSVDNTGNNRSITVQLSFVKPVDALAHDTPLAVTHTPITIEHDTVDAVPVTPQADE